MYCIDCLHFSFNNHLCQMQRFTSARQFACACTALHCIALQCHAQSLCFRKQCCSVDRPRRCMPSHCSENRGLSAPLQHQKEILLALPPAFHFECHPSMSTAQRLLSTVRARADQLLIGCSSVSCLQGLTELKKRLTGCRLL